ncbi:MAG TPA: ABC transporter permease [Thermoanaerobaculia bacterium]|nr:ABC transporter permease [Thermoanaerobaculia bacterium]
MVGLFRAFASQRRAILRHPATNLFIAATVAVGLAGILVVVAVADALYGRPLLYRDDQQLFFVFSTIPDEGRTYRSTSPMNYADWREAARTADLEAVSSARPFSLTGIADPRPLSGEYVSSGYFPMLGVDLAAGRHFTAEDDRAGAQAVVLLSQPLARELFEDEGSAVGQHVRLADRPFEVVGVLQTGYRGVLWHPIDLWVPLAQAGEILGQRYRNDRAMGWHLVVGRLRPGFSLEQARAELEALAVRLESLYPDANQGKRTHVESLRQFYFGDDLRRGLSYLMGASSLVLLLIVANVVALAFAQSTDSAREVAVRRALGATPADLYTTLATPLVTPLAGGMLCALVLAFWITPRLISLSDIPPASLTMQWIDARIGAAALGLVAIVGLAVTALAYRTHTGTSAPAILRSGGGSSPGRVRTLQRLVVLETALAVALLMGAGLLMRSLSSLQSGELGLETHSVSTLQVDLQPSRYEDPAARIRFTRHLLEEAAESSAGFSEIAVSGPKIAPSANLSAELIPEAAESEHETLNVYRHSITPQLTTALGIDLIDGRGFETSDHESARKVALVSRTVAELLGGREVLGRRFRLRPQLPEDPLWTVVGVLEDVAARDLAIGRAGEPDVYLPYEQAPERSFFLVARSQSSGPATIAQSKALEDAVRRLDRDLALAPVETMEQRYALLTADQTFHATVATCFSALAWGLTILGLFGVLDLSVRARRREHAIRLALGASVTSLTVDVLFFAVRLAGAGLLAGVALTVAMHRALRGLLVGVTSYDPPTLLWVSALVLVTAVLAGAVPAWRVRRVDATAELTRGE